MLYVMRDGASAEIAMVERTP